MRKNTRRWFLRLTRSGKQIAGQNVNVKFRYHGGVKSIRGSGILDKLAMAVPKCPAAPSRVNGPAF